MTIHETSYAAPQYETLTPTQATVKIGNESFHPTIADSQNWMALNHPNAHIVDMEDPETQRLIEVVNQDEKWDYLRNYIEAEKPLKAPPVIVGLFGMSGSGKGQVMKQLKALYGEQILGLPCDRYYHAGEIKDKKETPIHVSNYSIPSALDTDLLLDHLRALQQGRAIPAPIYDFGNHRRQPRQCNYLQPAEVIVVEGLMIADILKEYPDIPIIGVTAEQGTCDERKISRDIRERGRSRKEGERQLKQTVKPSWEKYGRPYMDRLPDELKVYNGQQADSPDENLVPATIKKLKEILRRIVPDIQENQTTSPNGNDTDRTYRSQDIAIIEKSEFSDTFSLRDLFQLEGESSKSYEKRIATSSDVLFKLNALLRAKHATLIASKSN